MSLLTYAARHLPAGLQTIVLALSPPLTYLLGTLARIERLRVLGLLGLGLGFAGVFVIIVGLGLDTRAPDSTLIRKQALSPRVRPGSVGMILKAAPKVINPILMSMVDKSVLEDEKRFLSSSETEVGLYRIALDLK